MKSRYILTFLLAAILFASSPVSAAAMNTGFATEPFDEETAATIRRNIDLVPISEPTEPSVITCFDVSETGLIAIAHDGDPRDVICVYSPDGEFLYGYSLGSNGTMGLEWDGDNILIYRARSSAILSVSSDAAVGEILSVPDCTENYSYLNHHIWASVRSEGDTTYRLSNPPGIINILADSYSLLTAEYADGTQTVLYDASKVQRSAMIGSAMIIIPFVTIVIFFVVKQFKSLRK